MQSNEQGEGGRRPPAWDIRDYESIDSTNLEAKRLLDAGASPGLVVTARHQTGGRGRMGRGWLDQPGKSLIVSLVLEDVEGFDSSMLVALAARAAIITAGGEGPRFKWPNDLVYGNRKAGGILAETYGSKEASPGSHDAAAEMITIVGLGLNVAYLPGELDVPAKLPPTSLLIEEGIIWNSGELLRGLLHGLEERWSRTRGELMSEYRDNLAYRGEAVRISAPYASLDDLAGMREDFEAVVQDVDDAGNLILGIGEKTLRLVSGDLHLDVDQL
jgi:BirA family biotin operon repressor/biotin-[acetyl-CoA-carboxylase] ligase